MGGSNDAADTDNAAGTPDAPAQTVDSSGEWLRARQHRAGESSRGARSGTILRRLTLAECARLQALPDWFEFHGSKTEAYRQIGNAVPPLLAWHVANAVREAMGLAPVAVPDVRAWYATPRPHWAAGAAWQRTAAAAAVAAGGAASADRRAIAP